jgi:DNA polymerase-3 subunit delta
MLIFVYGDDTFRVQEKVKELTAAFAKKFDPAGLNLSRFGSDAESGEVLQAVGSLPFMSQRRMVVIRDLVATTKKDGETAWASLANAPESSIVVLWDTIDIEKKPLYKVIASGAKQSLVHKYPFPSLEGTALTKWTADRVKARGGQIAPDALRELVERVGPDLWQMDNEIAKLVAWRGQGTPPITRADIDELVRANFEGEIFALVDAVSRKDTAKAIRLLEQERLSGASDFSIFGMLVRQVRIMLAARAVLDAATTPNPSLPAGRQGLERRGTLEQDMDLHPFVAQKALEAAKRFTFDELRATHDLLFKYDAGMKSGLLDAELAVDLATAKLVL